MTLREVFDPARWEELEHEIHDRYGLNAGVFDADGKKVTGYVDWCNPFCPAVRGVQDGLTHICACSNQVIARKAREQGTVVEECEAGLCKIAVPIRVADTFLGIAGGCGRKFEDSACDFFHVGRVTGIPLARLEELAADVGTITRARATEAAHFIQGRLTAMLPA